MRSRESTYASSKPTIPFSSDLQSTTKASILPRTLSLILSILFGPYIRRVFSELHAVQRTESIQSICIICATFLCIRSSERCQKTFSFESIIPQLLHCASSPSQDSDAHISCITSWIPIKSSSVSFSIKVLLINKQNFYSYR